VGSLSFLNITTGSSFVYLPLSSSVSSLRRAVAAVPAMCREPPLQSRSEASHASSPASLPPSPTPHWPPLFLPRRPALRPSRSSPLLAVAATQRHLLLPGDPTHRSLADRCLTPPRCLLPRTTRCPCCYPSFAVLPCAAGVPAPASTRPHLVLDPEHILELLVHSFLHCTHTFCSFSPAPTTSLHPTSAASPGHRRQPPTPPPGSNPVLPEHHRDPLVLLSLSNFGFSHRSTTLHSAGELQAPPSLGLPSTRRYRASPPRPRAPTTPSHLPKSIPPLLHHPPSP
jgi:hypothetical protein